MRQIVLVIIIGFYSWSFGQLQSHDVFKKMTDFLKSQDTLVMNIHVGIFEEDSSNTNRTISFMKIADNFYYDYRNSEMLYEDKIMMQINHESKILVVKKLKQSVTDFDPSKLSGDQDIPSFDGEVKVVSKQPLKYVIIPKDRKVISKVEVEFKEDLVSKMVYWYNASKSYAKKAEIQFTYGYSVPKEQVAKTKLEHYLLLKGGSLYTTEKFRGYEIILQD